MPVHIREMAEWAGHMQAVVHHTAEEEELRRGLELEVELGLHKAADIAVVGAHHIREQEDREGHRKAAGSHLAEGRAAGEEGILI